MKPIGENDSLHYVCKTIFFPIFMYLQAVLAVSNDRLRVAEVLEHTFQSGKPLNAAKKLVG